MIYNGLEDRHVYIKNNVGIIDMYHVDHKIKPYFNLWRYSFDWRADN